MFKQDVALSKLTLIVSCRVVFDSNGCEFQNMTSRRMIDNANGVDCLYIEILLKNSFDSADDTSRKNLFKRVKLAKSLVRKCHIKAFKRNK
jgi:NAD-specific glutamate dehydrogenase